MDTRRSGRVIGPDEASGRDHLAADSVHARRGRIVSGGPVLARMPTDVLRVALGLIPEGLQPADAKLQRDRILAELHRRRHPAESVAMPAAQRRVTTAHVARYLMEHVPNIQPADAHAAANGLSRTLLADLWLQAVAHTRQQQ